MSSLPLGSVGPARRRARPSDRFYPDDQRFKAGGSAEWCPVTQSQHVFMPATSGNPQPERAGMRRKELAMPTSKEDLPDTIKRTPKKAQDTYRETLDSAHEQYHDEER